MNPFVGRSVELSVIEEAFTAAQSGAPSVVWIEGPAGAGKSALVREAVSRFGTDADVRRTEGDELVAHEPFAAVRQWLEGTRSDSPFTAGMALLEGLDAVEAGKFTVVVIEDMHWVDPDSRTSLLTMARRFEHAPVVMIVTSRPGSDDDGWSRMRNDPTRCRDLLLEALSVEDIVSLAMARGIELQTPDAARIRDHTDGHALYVSMLLSEIPPDRLQNSHGPLPAPRSLASTTLAQLAGVLAPARELASAMAVVNRPASLPMLAQVAGIDQPTEALGALLRTGLVEWHHLDLLSAVTFVHPLFRTAIYDDLSPIRRRALHLGAAAVSGEATALPHRVAAADRSDEALAEDLESAAHRARASGDLQLASTYLRWAADVSVDRARHERRMLLAVDTMLDADDRASASGWQDWVARCAPSPCRDVILGRLAWDRGDAHMAEPLLTAAAAQQVDERSSVEAMLALSVLYVTLTRGAEAVAVSRRLLDRLDPESPEEAEAWTTLAIGQGAFGGAQSGLTLLSERLTERARDVSSRDSPLLTARSTLRSYANLQAEAAEDIREAIRRGGPPKQLIRLHVYLSRAEFALGDWDRALVAARVALDLSSQEQRAWELAQAHRAITSVLAARGAWEPAELHAALAVTAAVESGGVEQYFSGQLALADVARAREDGPGVVAALEPLIVGGIGSLPMLSTLTWLASMIEAQIATGDLDAAAVAIEELAQGWELRRVDLSARVMDLRGRLAAARGDTGAAVEWLGQAVAGTSRITPWIDRAELHRQFGRGLRAVGRRQAAIDQFRIAHEMATAVGATPFVERVTADLAATGLKAATTGGRRSPLGLTDREQDVVALVSRGMTNKEVAAALYVSVKAVEYHLSNVYGKLGLSSRRELRDSMLPDR